MKYIRLATLLLLVSLQSYAAEGPTDSPEYAEAKDAVTVVHGCALTYAEEYYQIAANHDELREGMLGYCSEVFATAREKHRAALRVMPGSNRLTLQEINSSIESVSRELEKVVAREMASHVLKLRLQAKQTAMKAKAATKP